MEKQWKHKMMSYISSYDTWWQKLPKKEIVDGLRKCLKNAFGGIIPKKEIPF